MHKTILALGATAALGLGTLSLGTAAVFAASAEREAGPHGMGAMMMHGGDATAKETGDIHALFDNHDKIDRTVTNLANGIRTVTESDDPETAQTIKDHVADMMTRVAEKRDPGLPIESPALRAIFENYDKIDTKVDVTEKGVIVTQTSADADVVALLQTHAGEVTAFVDEGMSAAHNSMHARNDMPMQAMRGAGHESMGQGPMGQGRMQMREQMRGQMHDRMMQMHGGQH